MAGSGGECTAIVLVSHLERVRRWHLLWRLKAMMARQGIELRASRADYEPVASLAENDNAWFVFRDPR
ncbi:MAG TPA: hypothetical protein VK524_25575 [Polyangiaceae bacterium]|nr:hypothetical protein [Polyangiaceae bacterium]